LQDDVTAIAADHVPSLTYKLGNNLYERLPSSLQTDQNLPAIQVINSQGNFKATA
jgi:hypothetical protein